MNNFYGIPGSETRISKILEDFPIGIISFNASGIIDYVNPAFSKMGILYRLKVASLIDSNIFEKEIIPGISLVEEITELKNGFPSEKEIKNLRTADGSEISLIIKCSPFYVNDQFAGGVLVLEDLKVISESREEDLLKIESFKKVTNEISDLFFVVDNEGVIKYSAGSKLNLVSFTDPKNINILEIIPNLPDDFKGILAEVQNKNDEKRFILKLEINSEPSFYECLINLLSTKKPKFLTCSFINISDKIKSENLEDRLSLFETVADVTSDGIIGVNAEGIITLCSPSVLSLTGFLDEETLGKPFWEFIPTVNQKIFNQLKEDLQQIHFFKKQILILTKTGSQIPVDASFLLSGDENIVISLFAVSEESKPENFKTLEENFRNLVTKADIIVLNLNNSGVIEYLNPAFTAQINFNEDETIGKNLNEFLTSETKLDFETFQDRSYNQELSFLTKRGEETYYTASIIPLFSENILNGFNIYLTNITEKKKEEKALQLFKFLFDNTIEGIAVENKGIIITANNAFGKMFGYSFGNEIVGKDILDLAAPNDVLKVAEYLQLYQTKKDLSLRFEFSGKRKNGSTFFSELTPSSFEINGSWYFVLIMRDITERKQAQQVIRESEEKYRNLIENIDDFFFTLEKSKLFFKPVFFTGAVKKNIRLHSNRNAK